jgi:hypothetical protein
MARYEIVSRFFVSHTSGTAPFCCMASRRPPFLDPSSQIPDEKQFLKTFMAEVSVSFVGIGIQRGP